MPVIVVGVAILTHSSSIQLVVWALPWLLGSALAVVAVVAHSLGVVGKLVVATDIVDFSDLFSVSCSRINF